MRRIIGCVLSVAMFGGILGASATTARADTWTGAPPPAGYTMVLGTSPDTGATRWIAVDSDLLPAEGLTEVVSSVVPSDPVGLSTNSGCWDYTKVAIGKNNIGTELWRLTMKRHWCGNYGVPLYPAVTSHPAATAQPNIKGIGGAWSWKGFVDGNTSLTGFCYSVSGFSGCPAHAEYVTGEFQLCVSVPFIGTYCISTKFPHIWINVHYNGAVASGVNNGGTEK